MEADFPGASTILEQIKSKKVARKRIGMILKPGAPARSGCKVVERSNPENVVGHVTSGVPSPTLGVNIAMAYVKTEFLKSDLDVVVRKSKIQAKVVKMPFVKTNYFFGK